MFPLQSIGEGAERVGLGDVVGMKDSQRLSVSTSQRVKKPHTEVVVRLEQRFVPKGRECRC